MENIKTMTTEQLLQEARNARAMQTSATHTSTTSGRSCWPGTNYWRDQSGGRWRRFHPHQGGNERCLAETQLRDQHEGAPAECNTEKISPVIDWGKTGAWMADNNMPLEPTYTVQVKVKPSKALAA